MKKQMITLSLAVLLTFATSLNAAAASTDKGNSTNVARQCYTQIERDVHSANLAYSAQNNAAVKQHDKIEKLVTAANAKIEKLVAHAQATKKDDVQQVLAQIDKIIENVMQQAAACGVTVECEYTAFIIDGQTVLIDPLRVVN